MSRAYPNASLFAGTWCVLAAWQTFRAFNRCQAASGWTDLFWALQVLCLAAPLFVVARFKRDPVGGQERHTADMTLTIVVLTYVPVMVSMRLLEQCVAAR